MKAPFYWKAIPYSGQWFGRSAFYYFLYLLCWLCVPRSYPLPTSFTVLVSHCVNHTAKQWWLGLRRRWFEEFLQFPSLSVETAATRCLEPIFQKPASPNLLGSSRASYTRWSSVRLYAASTNPCLVACSLRPSAV